MMHKLFKLNENLIKVNNFFIGVEKIELGYTDIHNFIDESGYEGISTNSSNWFWGNGDYKIVFTTDSEIIKAPLLEEDPRFNGCELLEVLIEYDEFYDYINEFGSRCNCKCHVNPGITHISACCTRNKIELPKLELITNNDGWYYKVSGIISKRNYNTEAIKQRYYSLYSDFINEDGVLELIEPNTLSGDVYRSIAIHLINNIGIQNIVNSDLGEICKQYINNYYSVDSLQNLPSSLIDDLRLMGCVTPWWMLNINTILGFGWVKIKGE